MRFAILFAFLIVPFVVSGSPADFEIPAPELQRLAAEAAQSRRYPAEGEPVMLWRIEKDGHTGWLAGSMHLAPDDIHPLPAVMTNVFREAGLAVFEVDPALLNEEFQRRMSEIGRLPAGSRLRDQLDPGQRRQLGEALRRIDAPASLVDEAKPWMAALVLTFSHSMRAANVSINNGIDRYFHQLARVYRKPVRGLESPDDQLALFRSLDETTGVEFLAKTLDELAQLEPLVRRMTDAWKAGDTDALQDIVDKSFAAYPAMRTTWLTDRNAAWADAIEHLMQEDLRPFITVGAAHVIGDDGMPALLAGRGFIVEQVREHRPAGAVP